MALPSKAGCTWSPDAQSFSLTGGTIQARDINLEVLQKQVVKEAHDLTLALANIVPLMNISGFNLNQLVDAVDDGISMFDQPQNLKVFAPFIQEVWTYLGKGQVASAASEATSIFWGGKISHKPAQKFLA